MSPIGSKKNEQPFYSRKEKSLGVLCTNFLSLYNHNGIELIGLDEAAFRLGIERRRIYDIVNILESVGLLARKAKNQYIWKGFGAIPRFLDRLKEEGLRAGFSGVDCIKSENVLNENECRESLSKKSDGQGNCKTEKRREKSLGLLTENFIKLFVCSDVDMISLDAAAEILLGDDCKSTAMRTKIRRLYDIANVLSSMNLIEKMHHPESRRPAFRWLGLRGSPQSGSNTSLDPSDSKKRVFGTDITNKKRNNMDSPIEITKVSSKKSQVDSSLSWMLNHNVGKTLQVKHEDSENDCSKNSSASENNYRHSTKSFVFGPFPPKQGGSNSKNAIGIHDLERLASTYRPQYSNQVE